MKKFRGVIANIIFAEAGRIDFLESKGRKIGFEEYIKYMEEIKNITLEFQEKIINFEKKHLDVIEDKVAS